MVEETPNWFGGANSTITSPIGESATHTTAVCRSPPSATPATHPGHVYGSAANS